MLPTALFKFGSALWGWNNHLFSTVCVCGATHKAQSSDTLAALISGLKHFPILAFGLWDFNWWKPGIKTCVKLFCSVSPLIFWTTIEKQLVPKFSNQCPPPKKNNNPIWFVEMETTELKCVENQIWKLQPSAFWCFVSGSWQRQWQRKNTLFPNLWPTTNVFIKR